MPVDDSKAPGCACQDEMVALGERVATLESALRLELGVDPAAHAEAQKRTGGGPAGDAGHVG